MEREVGGGIGMGNTCKPMAVSFQCMTKFTTNKERKKERKKRTCKKKKKKQRHYFANRSLSSQGYGFSSNHYGCESWTIKKVERRRIDTFELWC